MSLSNLRQPIKQGFLGYYLGKRYQLSKEVKSAHFAGIWRVLAASNRLIG